MPLSVAMICVAPSHNVVVGQHLTAGAQHDARAGPDRALKTQVGVDQNQTRFDHVALVGTQANAAVRRAQQPNNRYDRDQYE